MKDFNEYLTEARQAKDSFGTKEEREDFVKNGTGFQFYTTNDRLKAMKVFDKHFIRFVGQHPILWVKVPKNKIKNLESLMTDKNIGYEKIR